VAAGLTMLVACGSEPAAVRPTMPRATVARPEAEAPVDAAAAVVADAPALPEPPRQRLVLGAEETAPFVVRPADRVPFACGAVGCLAVWVEGSAVLALPYAAGTPLAARAERVLRVSGRDRIAVRALSAHPSGFAMLATIGRGLDTAALELVILDLAGAVLRRLPVGMMHDNSSEPALAMHDADGLIAYPTSETAIELVRFTTAALGARVSSTEAHVTTPQIGHDGERFVVTWIAWEPDGPIDHVRALESDAPVAVPYLDRPAFACATGSCVLVGARERAMRAVTFRGGATDDRVLVSPSAPNALAALFTHPRGMLALVRAPDGARAWVLDASGEPLPGEVVIDAGGELGVLASWRGHGYVELRVSPPADFAPVSAPCPGAEDATCMDEPDYYTLSFRTAMLVND
jgi:hypothetical protein